MKYFIYLSLLSYYVQSKSLPVNTKSNVQEGHERCDLTPPSDIPEPLKNLPPLCFTKPITGYCRAAFPSYHFDTKRRECIKTIYGGCGGCRPFGTKQECEKTCSSQVPKLTKEDLAKLKQEEEEKAKKSEKEAPELSLFHSEIQVPIIPKSETLKESLQILEDDLFSGPIPNPQMATAKFKAPPLILNGGFVEEDPFKNLEMKEKSNQNDQINPNISNFAAVKNGHQIAEVDPFDLIKVPKSEEKGATSNVDRKDDKKKLDSSVNDS